MSSAAIKITVLLPSSSKGCITHYFQGKYLKSYEMISVGGKKSQLTRLVIITEIKITEREKLR